MSKWVIKEPQNFFRCDGQTAVQAVADFCEVSPDKIQVGNTWQSAFPEGKGRNKIIDSIRLMADMGIDITLRNPNNHSDIVCLSVVPDNRDALWHERETAVAEGQGSYLISKSQWVNGKIYHTEQFLEVSENCLGALAEYLNCEIENLTGETTEAFYTKDTPFTSTLENSYRISALRHIILLRSDFTDTSYLYYVEKTRERS